MEQLKLRQISPKDNGLVKPSVVSLIANECQITGNILSSKQYGKFEILNSSSLILDENITAEVVYPGFLKIQALEEFYVPSWPIPECLQDFMANLEVNICANQPFIIQDQCLSDSFVLIQKLAEQLDITLLYFDFSIEFLYWQDQAIGGKSVSNSPLERFINLLGGFKPCIAILDGIEVLNNNWKDYDNISTKDFMFHVVKILRSIDFKNFDTSFVGICKDIAMLNPEFLSFFARQVQLKAPNTVERNSYLQSIGCHTRDLPTYVSNTAGQSYSEMYRNSQIADGLEDGLSDKLQELSIADSNKKKMDYRNTYLSPIIEKNVKQLDPIFGYTELMEKLKRLVILPLGILLHGPSGCGKSMIIGNLAKSANLPILTLRPHEVFSKYLGDSEKSLRDIFNLARANAPCVLFLDSFDIFAPRRKLSSEDSGVEERVLSTLLNEMDGVSESGNVLVVGATNRLEEIDDAFLRPGRFDQVVAVNLPDLKDRMEIIHGVYGDLLSSKQCELVASGSDGWSCSSLIHFKRFIYLKSITNNVCHRDLDIEANLVEFRKITVVST